MRNLLLLSDRVHTVRSLGDGQQHSRCSCITSEPREILGRQGKRFLLNSDGELVAVNSMGCVLWRVNVNDYIDEEDLDGVDIASNWNYAAFISELNGVFCSNANGCMVFVNCSNPALDDGTISALPNDSVEYIGAMDQGIVAASWRADQGVLLVVTGSSSVLALTTSWDVLVEKTLSPPISAINNDVSICWRADNLYVALTYVTDDASGKPTERKMVVLHGSDLSDSATGRNEDTLPLTGLHVVPSNTHASSGLSSIAWSPDCSLIAVGQTITAKKRLQVAFFEPNGLRHRELVISGFSHEDTCIAGLGWSKEGDALAVVLAPKQYASYSEPSYTQSTMPTVDSDWRVLQLYYRDNYHWYCAREMRFDMSPQSLRRLESVAWDTLHPLRLHYSWSSPATGEKSNVSRLYLQEYVFSWKFTSAAASQHDDTGCLATIGEDSLLRLNPLGFSVVPPPSAYSTLRFGTLETRSAPTDSHKESSTATAIRSLQPMEVTFSNRSPFNSSGRLGAGVANTKVVYNRSEGKCNPWIGSKSTRAAILSATGHITLVPLTFVHPTRAYRDFPQAEPFPTAKIPVYPCTEEKELQSVQMQIGTKDDVGQVLLAFPPSDHTGLVGYEEETPISLHLPSFPIPWDNGSASEPLYAPSWAIRHLLLLRSVKSVDAKSTTHVLFFVASSLVDTAGKVIVSNDTAIVANVVVNHDMEGSKPASITFQTLNIPDSTRVASVCTPWLQSSDDLHHVPLACVLQYSNNALQGLLWKKSQDESASDEETTYGSSFSVHMEPSSILKIPSLAEVSSSLAAFIAPAQENEDIPIEQRIVVVGIGARTANLSVVSTAPKSRVHVLLPSVSSIAWNGNHELLLAGTRGPSPLLVDCHASELHRATVIEALNAEKSLEYKQQTAGMPEDQKKMHPPLQLLPYPPGVQSARSAGGMSATIGVGAVTGMGMHAAAGGAVAAIISGGLEFQESLTMTSGTAARALERGCTIVACTPSSDAVHLQAARGNLETVVPRAITLATIRKLLDSRPVPQWSVAIELARAHRVDPNILVDHSIEAWMNPQWLRSAVEQLAAMVQDNVVGGARIKKAVAGKSGSDRWDQLLAALIPENVCQKNSSTMTDITALKHGNKQGTYAPPSWYVPPSTEYTPNYIHEFAAFLPRASEAELLEPSAGKVNNACASLRSALLYHMAKDPSDPTAPVTPKGIRWRHPLALAVISTYARQDPADLASILAVVQAVAQDEALHAVGQALPLPDHLSPVTGESALSHAILVCDGDPEILYTAALGSYDLRLVHALAQRVSSRGNGGGDPREYVPFLAGLARMAQPREGEVGPLPIDGESSLASVVEAPAKTESRDQRQDSKRTSQWPSSFRFGSFSSKAQQSTPVTLLPSGYMSLPSLPNLLSPGQVRQAFAIDCHLGRWPRAVEALVGLILLKERAASAEGTLKLSRAQRAELETKYRAASRALVPALSEDVVTVGLQDPSSTLLSLCFSQGLWEHALCLFNAAEGMCVRGRNSITDRSWRSDLTPNTSDMSLLKMLVSGRGWWIAVGSIQPDRQLHWNLSEGGKTQLGQSFGEQLLLATCPVSYCVEVTSLASKEGQTLQGELHNSLSEALSVFITSDPPAIDDAFALALAFPTIQLLPRDAKIPVPSASSVSAVLFAHVAMALSTVPSGPGRRKTTVVMSGDEAKEVFIFAENPLVLKGECRDLLTSGKEKSMYPLNTRVVANIVGKSLLNQGRGGVAAHGARMLLQLQSSLAYAELNSNPTLEKVNNDDDWEEEDTFFGGAASSSAGGDHSVETLIDAIAKEGRWHEAATQAALYGRGDLVETMLVPELTAAADILVANIAERATAIVNVLKALAKCRETRSKMSLAQLVGETTAELILMHVNNAGKLAGELKDEEENWAEGHDIMDDGASAYGGVSTWSAATGTSSVVSHASGLSVGSYNYDYATGVGAGVGLGLGLDSSGSRSIAGGSVISGASLLSTHTVSHSSGLFSHFSAQNVSQTLGDTKASLRLQNNEGANDPRFAQANREAEVTTAAVKKLQRLAQKKLNQEQYEAGELPRRRLREGKNTRSRPGSIMEQNTLESELLKLLPSESCSLMSSAFDIVTNCIILGMAPMAKRIAVAINDLMKSIQSIPLPCARVHVLDVACMEAFGRTRDGLQFTPEAMQLASGHVSTSEDPTQILLLLIESWNHLNNHDCESRPDEELLAKYESTFASKFDSSWHPLSIVASLL